METTSDHMVSAPIAVNRGAPIFLHIPILRLIVMSIFTCGLYELYWMYKNWKYLQLRDKRFIRPFWRAWFGIFYCHRLLETMHSDRELIDGESSRFAPAILATLWVVLILTAYALGRSESVEAAIAAILMPSYLCFVPVQLHINRINRQMDPGMRYTKWTKGHFFCILYGTLIWISVLSLMMQE